MKNHCKKVRSSKKNQKKAKLSKKNRIKMLYDDEGISKITIVKIKLMMDEILLPLLFIVMFS